MKNFNINTYQTICSILDEMGFTIFEKEDFAISDYIVDSLQFISFIFQLESKLEIELPDDFMLFDILKSAYGLSNKLGEYIESVK